MLIYNTSIMLYLAYLGVAGGLGGILLWPAIAIHAVLALRFAYAWSNDHQPKPRNNETSKPVS